MSNTDQRSANSKKNFFVSKQQHTKVNTSTHIVLERTNHKEWLESLQIHFQSESVKYGKFILKERLIDEPDLMTVEEWKVIIDKAGLTDKQTIAKLKIDEITKNIGEKQKRKEFYALAFNTILMTVKSEHRGLLRSDRDWKTIEDSENPLKLLELIERVIIHQIQGLAPTESEDYLIFKFYDNNKFSQAHNEETNSYVTRSEALYTTLKGMGCTRVGTDAECIRKIVRGLDNERYKEYKNHVMTETNEGNANAYPTTFSSIVGRADAYMLPFKPKSAHSIFSYPTDVKRKKCTHCNKPGHEEDSCWRKHPELTPKHIKKSNEKKQSEENKPTTVSETKDSEKHSETLNLMSTTVHHDVDDDIDELWNF